MEDDRLYPPWSQNAGLTEDHNDHVGGNQCQKIKKIIRIAFQNIHHANNIEQIPSWDKFK